MPLRRLIFTLLFWCPLAVARWATLEDSPAVSELDNYEIYVNADGTSRCDRERVIEIKNEEGRSAFGTTTLKYNSRASKMVVTKAETRNQGKTYTVDPKFIEDKPLASSAEGFDEVRQINIAFPNVDTGSKLYLKYSEETTEVPFVNFYSQEIIYGSDLYEKSSYITVKSAMPLFVETNDPSNAIKVTQKREKDKYVTILQQKKPVFSRPIDEDDPYLNHFARTFVVLSSSKNYPDLAKSVSAQYEAIINSELPKPFAKIAEAAKKKKTTVEKMDTVTSLLADQIRYLGDWRPTRGGHIPRPLNVIASTKFGDCKDFSVSIAAILRRMGFNAQVAWVERGQRPSPLPKLVLADAFNHAITYVHDKDRDYWLDGTNLGSFAAGTLEDIEGRQALIVSNQPELREIPLANPADSKRVAELKITFDKERDALIEANLNYTGRRAAMFAGATREYSKDTLNHLIAKAVANNNYIKWTKFESYDLSSRIAKDLGFKAKIGVKNLTLKTTAGNALLFERGVAGRIIDLEEHTRVSDLYLAYPQTDRTTYRLMKSEEIGSIPIECSLDSKWIKLSRTLERKPGEVVVVDTTEIKTPRVTNVEMKGKEFQKFQSEVQSCFNQVAIVFK